MSLCFLIYSSSIATKVVRIIFDVLEVSLWATLQIVGEIMLSKRLFPFPARMGTVYMTISRIWPLLSICLILSMLSILASING